MLNFSSAHATSLNFKEEILQQAGKRNLRVECGTDDNHGFQVLVFYRGAVLITQLYALGTPMPGKVKVERTGYAVMNGPYDEFEMAQTKISFVEATTTYNTICRYYK